MDPYFRLSLQTFQTETMKSGLVHLYHSFRGFSVECLGETWQAVSCCVRLSERNGRVRPIAMIDLLDVSLWNSVGEISFNFPLELPEIQLAYHFGRTTKGKCFDFWHYLGWAVRGQPRSSRNPFRKLLVGLGANHKHAFFLLQVANEHNVMSFKCNCFKWKLSWKVCCILLPFQLQ